MGIVALYGKSKHDIDITPEQLVPEKITPSGNHNYFIFNLYLDGFYVSQIYSMLVKYI